MIKDKCPRDGGLPFIHSVHDQQHGEGCPNERHAHVECLACGYEWTSKQPVKTEGTKP